MKYHNIESTIEDLVTAELAKLSHTNHVRILHAVESGSRAWGFASPDSDYDVRFIYVRTPDAYLSLNPHKDYIDGILDETLDINGWDLTKFLQQIHRANATVFEWLNSPIIYQTTHPVMEHIHLVAERYFAIKPFLYHYYGTAKNNYESYLKEAFVKYKKYFYVLRPLLACQWIEEKRTPPPVLFQTLLDNLPDLSLKHEIASLRIQKMQMTESEKGPVIATLHAYIEDRLSYYSSLIPTLSEDRNPNWDDLNRVFREILSDERTCPHS